MERLIESRLNLCFNFRFFLWTYTLVRPFPFHMAIEFFKFAFNPFFNPAKRTIGLKTNKKRIKTAGNFLKSTPVGRFRSLRCLPLVFHRLNRQKETAGKIPAVLRSSAYPIRTDRISIMRKASR